MLDTIAATTTVIRIYAKRLTPDQLDEIADELEAIGLEHVIEPVAEHRDEGHLAIFYLQAAVAARDLADATRGESPETPT